MHLGRFHHGLTQPIVHLGDEPPLVVYDERNVLPDRRRVSVRWLTGAILTGITSVVLMGGAMMAALDGQYSVSAAVSPDAPLTALRPQTDKALGSKGDRVTRGTAQFATKMVIPVNVVARVGDRDHIKVRPYTLITSSLATRKNTDLAAQIPAFNPLAMFADVQVLPDSFSREAVFGNSIYGAKVEGEVTISLTEFPIASALIDPEHTLTEEDVELSVRQSARFMTDNTVDLASRSLIDPGRFDFALAQQTDFSRLSVRITPENVSFVSKKDEETRFTGMDEKIIPVAANADFLDILLDNEANDAEAEAILTAFSLVHNIDSVVEGQRIRLALAPSPDGSGRLQPERISLYSDTVHQATVARSDDGRFIMAEAPTTFLADAFAEADRISYGGPTPSLYDSIYQTALEQEMPTELIDELVRMFSFDVDFNARVKPGDSFEVFYGEQEEGSSLPPELLFASLNTGSSKRRFYRYRTTDDNVIDYYDVNGRSAKKFLMRKPLSGGRYRSGFGMRRHPIKKYRKMHTGVDWAAARGTPIMAAGNGTVLKSKWVSGYGRRVELQHTNGYVTTYSHMTRFAKGVTPGVRVNQGQIIGYVGSTGLSTGPHLHYEVKVNNRYVDPMRIKLPRGRVLDGEMLAGFDGEVYRIDDLMEQGRRPSRVAASN